jgi:hypothetical protein
VYGTGTGAAHRDGEPIRVRFAAPAPVKQIWINANQLPLDEKNTDRDFVFSFAAVHGHGRRTARTYLPCSLPGVKAVVSAGGGVIASGSAPAHASTSGMVIIAKDVWMA